MARVLIIGGFLAVKVQRILIILSTSLLGSFRAVLALSYFTSQIDWMFYVRQPEQMPALIDNNPWMFPSILALAVVAVFVQLGLGGGSDANFTSAMGIPTLDGLGADGDGAHTLNEYVLVSTLEQRLKFWELLLRDLA